MKGKFVSIGDYAPSEKYGDVDGNGIVNAIDASEILTDYAALSTGASSSFSENQKKLADVNGNGVVDATDASAILGFYSYVSSGGKESDLKKWLETVEN